MLISLRSSSYLCCFPFLILQLCCSSLYPVLSRTDLGSILLQLREGIASEHHVVLRDDLKLPMKKPSIVAERRKAKTTERLKKRKARAELESRGEKASWDEWLALLSSDDEVAEDDAHNDVLVETDDSIKPKVHLREE